MFGRNKKSVDVELFTIYDSKTKSYNDPSFAQGKEDLMREIQNMFRDPSQARNRLLLNAEDFSVFRIGAFDRATGKLIPQELEHICNLHDIRALATPQDPQRPDLGIVGT